MSQHQQVNASGFPLQLAIARVVREEIPGWDVLYEEHAWKSDASSGFIDLAIEWSYKTWVMNIECKRVRDSEWIFLKDLSAQSERRHAKLWISYYSGNGTFTKFDWADIPMDPASPESNMCMVPGQDHKAAPMLERVSSGLVMSTEALAQEEAVLLKDQYSGLRMYQNVIVTTAKLTLCEVDPSDIDISTGEIGPTATFSDVPFIRFRKQLGVSAGASGVSSHIHELRTLSKQSADTVFVVNSRHFAEFVKSCAIDNQSLMDECRAR